MSSSFDKLKAKLLELFMLDQPDLDFGIYRIMNSKRAEITRFLQHELLPQVRQALELYEDSDRAHLQAELDQAIEQARTLGVDPETTQKVRDLRARMAGSVDLTAVENQVYGDLYNFFRRYYDQGDFLSLRRYKEGVYAIPYEGEEVKLYWANHDQYYIKTSEYLRDYAFILPNGRRVHFKLAEADVERDNIKAASDQERRFVLAEEDFITEEGGELVIRFHWVPRGRGDRQKDLNAQAAERILAVEGFDAWITALAEKAPTERNPDRTLLEKHLTDYTARNTFDYFIHKDLGGFLRRELDFFIKNEIMHLDDIEGESAPRVEQYLARIRAIRRIAHKIIDFLAQLEDFQKKLWLKKKFVVETEYCITLDRIPEAFYEEIAANEAQRQEWVRLFAIDEIKAEQLGQVAYSEPLTVDFLKANPHLVLDTKFFPQAFKDKLLGALENIDEQTNGVLVQSENFQALNHLMDGHQGMIRCVYIDPPYNTDATPILYKNNYRASSWLSLIADRLRLAINLLQEGASYIVVAIDDHELARLSLLLEQLFPAWDCHRVIVNHYPGSGTGRSNVTRTHEYALFLTPKGQDILRGSAREKGWRERGFCRSGTGENNYRVGRPNSFYAVLVDDTTCEIRGFEPPPDRDTRNYPKGRTDDGFVRVYPLGGDGAERCWTLSYESAIDAWKKGLLICTENMVIKRRYWDEERRDLLPSVWLDTKFSAVAHGTNLLTDMLGDSGLFSYPKSVFTVSSAVEAGTYISNDAMVCDFFAGSGTTGHAVIDLNREDSGNRRYILVEMGEYFDTVLKPRIQKAVYSKDWRAGKPASRDTGVSHMFKYVRLESYEDCLNNLQLTRTPERRDLLEANAGFRESYMLGYMLDTEARGSASLLNIDAFEDPFSYTLNIATGSVGETRPVVVDLVETFNWLLGLRVRHIDTIRGFRVVEGTNPSGQKVLVIWRSTREKSNADLEAFFQKQQYNTQDMEFDLIYVNGDNNLENLRRDEDTWKVRLIEEEFQRLMFDVQDV